MDKIRMFNDFDYLLDALKESGVHADVVEAVYIQVATAETDNEATWHTLTELIDSHDGVGDLLEGLRDLADECSSASWVFRKYPSLTLEQKKKVAQAGLEAAKWFDASNKLNDHEPTT